MKRNVNQRLRRHEQKRDQIAGKRESVRLAVYVSFELSL